MQKSVSMLVFSFTLFCIHTNSATAQYKPLNQPEKDFSGSHSVPAKTEDVTLRLGTLLSDGSITVGEECDGIDIIITAGSSDLEGLITIKDNCSEISIDISDSFDTTGKVVVGKNCRVKIKCGSDFRGFVEAGANSKVKIITAPDGTIGGKVNKDPTAKVFINDNAVK